MLLGGSRSSAVFVEDEHRQRHAFDMGYVPLVVL
jgi:hypothetical protein